MDEDSFYAEGQRAFYEIPRYECPYISIDSYAAKLWFAGYDAEYEENYQ